MIVEKEKHKGVTFGFYAPRGYFGSEEARQQVDNMVELNVSSVAVTPTVFQDTYCSTRQYIDFVQTPGDDEVASIVDYIHSKGMKVLLRPMLETQDGHGRNTIWFPKDRPRIPERQSTYRADWFRGMEERTLHYAKMAQALGCEYYELDSELDRMIDANEHWLSVLAAARSVYSGPIGSCHTLPHTNYLEALEKDYCWWHQLDMLSCSGYLNAAKRPAATVEEIIEGLQPFKEKIQTAAERFGKTFFFGECGSTACTGAAMRPASWSGGERYAPQEQANYLEAIFQTFWNEDWCQGLYWWKWDEHNDRPHFKDDPAGDKGFELYGKPAANVMKEWFSQ